MTATIRAIILDQLDGWRDGLFLPRMQGLTDDEYFWEPAPDCWTVRVGEDGRATCDWAVPHPDPPPVTTIAWRLSHLASSVLAAPAAKYFEGGRILDFTTFPWPATAEDALALVADGVAAWRSGIESMSEAELDAPLGPEEVYSVGKPFAVLAFWINCELIHHGAEVCLLRDLYRSRAGYRPAGVEIGTTRDA